MCLESQNRVTRKTHFSTSKKKNCVNPSPQNFINIYLASFFGLNALKARWIPNQNNLRFLPRIPKQGYQKNQFLFFLRSERKVCEIKNIISLYALKAGWSPNHKNRATRKVHLSTSKNKSLWNDRNLELQNCNLTENNLMCYHIFETSAGHVEIIRFLTASSLTRSKELLRHFFFDVL